MTRDDINGKSATMDKDGYMRNGSYVATWKNGDPIEPDQTEYDMVDTSAMLRPQSCIDAARKEKSQ